MTAGFWALLLLSQICLVAGQVVLKRGLTRGPLGTLLPAGIGLLAGWFFLWITLLKRHELSLLYPFQGLSPVLMALAAALFLRERPTGRTWLGVLLIAAGTALVGLSRPT